MQELEKILEEIDCRFENLLITDDECRKTALSKHDYEKVKYYRTGIVFTERAMDIVKDVIHKHMNGLKCGECSLRKWYQKGYEDGKKNNDGWIPVEEQLPKEYGEYLVTIVPSAGYLWAKRIIANFSDLMGIVKKPIFYTGEVGKIDFEDITGMVIAWNPLPEPYQPERSDNHDGE